MAVLKTTRSICPKCYRPVKASVIESGTAVFMIKRCPVHGRFKVLIEKNASFYKQLLGEQTENKQKEYDKLQIPISFSCNLNCHVCYFPYRNPINFSLDKIKKEILHFDAPYILLSGGEPTMRDDLNELIRFMIKNGKIPILLTNGLKLAELDYAKKLEDAGLRYISFSFNGFSDSAYKKINNKNLLAIKLKALENIKKTRMNVAISMLVKKGLNEEEIKKVINYCLDNDSFVHEFRARPESKLRKGNRESLFLSELLVLVCEAIGINKEEAMALFKKATLKPRRICSISADLYFLKENNNYRPIAVNFNAFPSLDDKAFSNLNKRIWLSDLLKITKIGRVWTLYGLFRTISLRRFANILTNDILRKGRLVKIRLELRKWSNEYSIDFKEVSKCPSLYLTKDSKKIPFCQYIAERGNMKSKT